MIVVESIRLALARLRANALRSGLTVLGIVIGVGSVVALVAVGQGSAAETSAQFSSLGANVLTVASGRGFGQGVAGASGSGTPLTMADVEALRAADGVAAVAPRVQQQATLTVGDTSVQADVTGTTPEAVQVDDLELAAGSFFSAFAASSRLPVAVVGSSLAGDLGLGTTGVGIGRVIDADGVRFSVIGVLAEEGGFGPGGNDDALLVPWQAMAGRLVEADPEPGQIQVAAEPGAETWFESSVSTAMRAAHQLGAEDEDDFQVLDPASLIEAVEASGATFTRLITAIAAISLVVGGIGIANVMLVAVRERTREIGVRRAIGARRRDVLAQFLTEATVLSLVGGLIGVAGGLAVAWALPGLSGQATRVSYPAAVIAFAVSGLVGMVAGIGPANQAARLDPAAALRYE